MARVAIASAERSYSVGLSSPGSWGDLPKPENVRISKASKRKIKGVVSGLKYEGNPSPERLSHYEFELKGRFSKGKTLKSIPEGIVKSATYTLTKGPAEDVAGKYFTLTYSGLRATVADFLSTKKSYDQHKSFITRLFEGDDIVDGVIDSGTVYSESISTGAGDDLVNIYAAGDYTDSLVQLGEGDDIINHYGNRKVVAYGGEGADVFRPSVNGYMQVMDFQDGLDTIDVRGISFEVVYSTDETFVPAREGFSLVAPGGREFARFNYWTPFVFI